MNNQTIPAADLHTLYRNSNDEGKRVLEKNYGTEYFNKPLPVSLQEVYEYNGVTEDQVVPFKDPQTDFQKWVNACANLAQIYEAYNKGEKPDWKNPDQYKYRNWYWMDGRSGSRLSLNVVVYAVSITDVASRLHALDETNAELIYKNFPQVVEDFMLG